MRWNQILLLEKEIPHSSYGYWITDTGEFLSVPYEGHQKVAYQHSGKSYGHALQAGWIRIVLDHNELIVNYELGTTNVRAVASVSKLIRQTDLPVRIELRGRSYSGALFTNKADALAIIRKTTAAAVAK